MSDGSTETRLRPDSGRPGRILASATAWGTGAAAGVALGGRLTSAGQVGAGADATDLSGLIILLAVAFIATFVVAAAVMTLTAVVHAKRSG